MKTILAFLIATVVVLFALPVSAFNVPAMEGHVTDKTGRLSVADKQDLERKLDAVNKSSTNEIVVLVINSLNGEAVEDVSYQVAKAWKPGKVDADNGVLLLIAMGDRKTRIETGKGVGGALTDIQSKDILQNKLAPQLRRGNLKQGIEDATMAIAAQLSGDKTVAAKPVPTSHHVSGWAVLAVFAGVGFLGFLFYLIFLREKKTERYAYSSYASTPSTPSSSSPYVSSIASSGYSGSTRSSSKPSSSGSSSSSSSSSYSSGSSYSGGSSSSYDSGGGGFSGGGGDFGGGGASGDF